MTRVPDTSGIFLTSDGSPLTLDIAWKRDQVFEFAIYDYTLAALNNTGIVLTATFRARPLDSAILMQKTLTNTATPADGKSRMAVTSSDLSSLSIPDGERYTTIWFDISAAQSSASRACRDGALNFIFPARVWASLKGVPN